MTTAGLIAKKIGMTRMVDAEGHMTAVTLLQLETQKVTKILSEERDGYVAYQVGYLAKKEKHLSKSDTTRLRKVGVQDNFTRFKEFRVDATGDLAVGATIELGKFFEGVSAVDITGISKGCGFSGAHKRWNSAVGRMTHGSRFHRRPGSLGMRSTPGRVFKNRHQPGQEGNTQTTIQNLQVLDVDQTNSVVAVRGSVPGHRDGFLIVKPSIKAKTSKTAAPKK
ncbi:MAG: 50S ribosomal protein L3 [Deltaproteobacteria bacterium]|nr:50S ribosomal protein L3 [Deltaproteobacteria bacterium]